jgi:hypothetical protein
MSEDYPETIESDSPLPLQEEAVWEAEPILTREVTGNQAPEFGSCMTWTVPQNGVGQAIPVLNRRIRRTTGAISIISLTGATAVVFNSKPDSLNGPLPQGATFLAIGTRIIEWENQEPLYAIAIGGTAQVTAIDESYAER